MSKKIINQEKFEERHPDYMDEFRECQEDERFGVLDLNNLKKVFSSKKGISFADKLHFSDLVSEAILRITDQKRRTKRRNMVIGLSFSAFLATGTFAFLQNSILSKTQEEIFRETYDRTVKIETRFTTYFSQDSSSMRDLGPEFKQKGIAAISKNKLITYREVTEDGFKKRARETTLDGLVLKPLDRDSNGGIVFFQLTEELCKKYCNEGVPIANKYEPGEKVFMIGNFKGLEKSLKFGRIGNFENEGEIIITNYFRGNGSRLNYLHSPLNNTEGNFGDLVYNMGGEWLGFTENQQGRTFLITPSKEFFEYLK